MHHTLPNFNLGNYLNLMQWILIIVGGGGVELILEMKEENLQTASNQWVNFNAHKNLRIFK